MKAFAESMMKILRAGIFKHFTHEFETESLEVISSDTRHTKEFVKKCRYEYLFKKKSHDSFPFPQHFSINLSCEFFLGQSYDA